MNKKLLHDEGSGDSYFLFYDAFSSYRVSYSSMKSLRMMGLGPVHLVRALFHYPLASPLVVSVAPVLKW